VRKKEKGKLLREAIGNEVVNMARYYYHETVCVGGRDDDIYNICKGLDITRATNYKPEDLMMPPRPARVQISMRKDRSSSRKRSSSCAELPPSKRTCLSSPNPIQNQVHRRVITCDYERAVYKASSRAAMLAAYKGHKPFYLIWPSILA
jgi:hypothetical protein